MNLNELMGFDVRSLTPEQLEKMDHGQLMLLRKAAEKQDPSLNEFLAPYEHQAFAREYVKSHPVAGTLGVGTAIPLYALAKMAGFRNGGTATSPSLKQIMAGYKGIGQGLGAIK